MNQKLPVRYTPEEIPFDQHPHGKPLGAFKNRGEMSRQVAAVSFAYFFACGALTFCSWTFNGVPDVNKDPFSYLAFLLFIAIIIVSGSISFLFLCRRAYIQGQVLEIFEDGFIFRGRSATYSYLWWLNLVNYQVRGEKDTLRLILKMNDGRRFTITQEYPSLRILLDLLPYVTGITLFNRMIDQLQRGESVPFGVLSLSLEGLSYQDKTIAWQDILSLRFYADIRRYVIWVRDPDVETDMPAIPRRFAVVNQDKFPNQQVFLDFMKQLMAYKARFEQMSSETAKLRSIWEHWHIQHWHRLLHEATNAAGMLAAGALMVGIGIIGLDSRTNPHMDQGDEIRSGIAFLMGPVGLVVGGLGLLSVFRQAVKIKLQPELTLALYDTGIAVNIGKTDFVCKWSELRGYRISSYLPLWASRLPFVRVGTEIIRVDGQTLFLDHAFQGIQSFLGQFRQRADKNLRAQLEERLRIGQTVEFGPLQVSLTALSYCGKTVDCTEIADYRIARLWLHIFIRSGSTETIFARINLQQILNSGILIDWLRTLVEQNKLKR